MNKAFLHDFDRSENSNCFLFANFENFLELRRQRKNHFTTQPLHKKTIRNLVDKFKETGSIHDRERSVRSHLLLQRKLLETLEKWSKKPPICQFEWALSK